MGFLRGCGQGLLVMGIVGLALVSVSSPLIPRISFLEGQFDQNIKLFLGMTGGCVNVGESQTCPSARLGYSITLDNFPGRTSDGPEPINSTLSYTLVMYPIAALLAILAFLLSLAKRSRVAHYTSISLIAFSFVSSAAALVTSLLLFIRAMRRINEQFAPASPASLGVAIWIAIVAVVLVAFSGMLISSHPPPPREGKQSHSRNASSDKYIRSQGDIFYPERPTYTQQYGSYSKPVISDPQYIHQGMNIEIDRPRTPNEGFYYQSDTHSQAGGDFDDEKYSQSGFHARTSSYQEEMMMDRRQPSLRRSVSRSSRKSKR